MFEINVPGHTEIFDASVLGLSAMIQGAENELLEVFHYGTVEEAEDRISKFFDCS